MDRAAIPGSAPDHTGARREGAVDPDTPVRATIVLRSFDSGIAAELLSGSYDPSAHTAPVANNAAISAVEDFARAAGLKVDESDAAARTVGVSGPASRMAAAFGITFGQFVSPDGLSHVSYDGAISLPSDIAPYVLAVLGLDSRPIARHGA